MRATKRLRKHLLQRHTSIAPLITFRVLFGGLMMVGAVRFMLNGWVERLYGEPVFFFKYYGFEWVEVLPVSGMYAIYTAIAISAAMVMLGLFYRVAIIVFFLTFTYAELTDVTNYLNHYYLVCLLAFLMIFLPAHRRFSLDVWQRPKWRITQVPAWTIHILILQIAIVYFCAGYAKLNPDWLFRAMPLATWLPARADLPLIGWLFQYGWTPFAFSWAGAFYDLTVPFFLLHRRTRPVAYTAVVVFHGLTFLLFNIGLFPFIMISNTLIFFPGEYHERWWAWVGRNITAVLRISFSAFCVTKQKIQDLLRLPLLIKQRTAEQSQRTAEGVFKNSLGRKKSELAAQTDQPLELFLSGFPFHFKKKAPPPGIESKHPGIYQLPDLAKKVLKPMLLIFFLIQLTLPFRYLLYSGNVLLTEEGYRFAWRVMLVEKAGQATFTVHDPTTGRIGEVINSEYLTPFQEKQMAIQPDLILQFAHFLADEYREKYGISNPMITVDSHVALNGRPSQQFIDPEVNLAAIEDGFWHKPWILLFKQQ